LRSSKKLLRKLDKTIPGLSKLLDPKNFDPSWGEEAGVELASSLILNSEKKKKLEKSTKKQVRRKEFSKLVKQKVLIEQNFQCASCKSKLEIVDFDHIDGKSSNNDISNCQALCPNCHAKKTRKKG